MDAVRSVFAEAGYYVARGMLTLAEVEHYRSFVARLAADPAEKAYHQPFRGFAQKDGVSHRPELWDLIFRPDLLSEVRRLIGEDIMYVRHTDIHRNYPIHTNWHRDITLYTGTVFKRMKLDPSTPYGIVRALFYLEDTRFTAWNESHKRPATLRKSVVNVAMRIARRVGYEGVVPVGKTTTIHLKAGDCLIINVLLLHTGCFVDKGKCGVFIAYGLKNRHSIAHSEAYGSRSNKLMPLELRNRLENQGLWY